MPDDKPERRTRADDKFDRYAWRDAVFADPKTPTNAKCLAFGIAKYVNGETGEAVVWTATLAEVCGLSQTWVRNTIPVLHNTGWAVIQIGSRGRGLDHCNVYRINPVKRTPSALLEMPKKRTRGALFQQLLKEHFSAIKENFSPLKENTGCTEPLNPSNPKERGSAARTSNDVRDSAPTNSAKTTSVDAPLNPAKSTSDDAPVPATDRPVARTADAALKQPDATQKQPTPERNETKLGTAGTAANGADADGGAVMATPVDTEAEFQFLRDLFPNRDDEAGSRLAYCAVLRESADVHQTMGLLRYGARRYVAFLSERLASGFQPKIKTLAQFIESGLWRGNNAKDAIARAAAGHAGLDQHNQIGQARSNRH
jgi:hypothetical protein